MRQWSRSSLVQAMFHRLFNVLEAMPTYGNMSKLGQIPTTFEPKSMHFLYNATFANVVYKMLARLQRTLKIYTGPATFRFYSVILCHSIIRSSLGRTNAKYVKTIPVPALGTNHYFRRLHKLNKVLTLTFLHLVLTICIGLGRQSVYRLMSNYFSGCGKLYNKTRNIFDGDQLTWLKIFKSHNISQKIIKYKHSVPQKLAKPSWRSVQTLYI